MGTYLDYEAMTQAALRGVMRESLRRVAENGVMPGDHHFYITFRTRAPGVKIADYLSNRFPEEMTIVVQHQFWDLEAHDGHFEIILKFSGVPQHLEIPYAAVTAFMDPSAKFGLTFQKNHALSGVIEPELAGDGDAPRPAGGGEGQEGTVVNLDAFRKR